MAPKYSIFPPEALHIIWEPWIQFTAGIHRCNLIDFDGIVPFIPGMNFVKSGSFIYPTGL